MVLGLSRRSIRAQEQPHRLCTIPPRQQLSITRWLAIRRWRVTYRGRIRIRIRIKLNVITRPAHTYGTHTENTTQKRNNTHTKPQKNHHTNLRMGNSNNKMTRSCVPSSTGSDKNNKTMDERIDALVLRLHEVFLLSRSSRFIKPVVFVRIFKHFERFFPVKSRLRVVVF